MSQPLRVIDRLFDRLMATYGREFSDLYAEVNPEAVKAIWADELRGVSWYAIAWALESLPERCPNVIRFRALCRQAPSQAKAVEDATETVDPERVAAELTKLRGLSTTMRTPRRQPGNRAWAHDILERYRQGAKINPLTLQFAREATALRVPDAQEA